MTDYQFDPELVDAAERTPAPDLTDLASARSSGARRAGSVAHHPTVREDEFEVDIEPGKPFLGVRVYRPFRI